jgi:DNA processing protein
MLDSNAKESPIPELERNALYSVEEERDKVPNQNERYAAIALALCPTVEPGTIRRLKRAFGSATAIWESSVEAWTTCGSIRPDTAQRLDEWRRRFSTQFSGVDIEAHLLRRGIYCILQGDEGYPAGFYDLVDPPSVVFAKGRLSVALNSPIFAVVGTRRASGYGLEAAKWISETCASAGCAIVSGLALGIDGAAHKAALKQSGATIAILGCGVDVCYPPSHRHLYDHIAEEGLILSEYPPTSVVQKHRFPERNRLIAAIADAVVIVQAGEKSGALRTVDAALDLGREVYAVPGPITSIHFRGSHQLIQQGARILLDPKDMLRDFGMASSERQDSDSAVPERWRMLYDAITDSPTVSELAHRVQMPIQSVYAGLLELELGGFIQKQPGGIYVRVSVG